MNNTFKNLMPLVVITASLSGCIMLIDADLRGADVNLTFADGRTPLCCAAESDHVGVVALLVAHGANVNAEAKGRTALKAARKNGNREIIGLLSEHGARE